MSGSHSSSGTSSMQKSDLIGLGAQLVGVVGLVLIATSFVVGIYRRRKAHKA